MTRVGFIGLGVMGQPMAANLLAAGHEVTAHNRSRAPVEALVEKGAAAATGPAEAAEGAEVVITMLPDSDDVAAVVPDVLDAADPGTLLIDMSSISPVVARALAAEAARLDVTMLDAPVSGGDVGARDGTLSIMVGGSVEGFARARPLLDVLGKTIIHVGDAGAGQVVKACNQVVVALTIEAVSEGLVLGSKAGVDPALILDVLSGGLAGNKVMEVRRRNFLEHDFTPGFRCRLHSKDLKIALETAREFDVALPATALVAQMFASLAVQGHDDDDHSALLSVIEAMSAHRIGDDVPGSGPE
jgi:2-hydroxy-3-oxopropionate reductase